MRLQCHHIHLLAQLAFVLAQAIDDRDYLVVARREAPQMCERTSRECLPAGILT
jgi:hypothetical protein